MQKVALILTITMLFSFYSFSKTKKCKEKKAIKIEYKNKPFYFRFPPKLRNIKSKKIIIAKIDYDHPSLGKCTYEVVKDLDQSKFFGWCNTKKIKRRKTQIFEIGEKDPKLPLSDNKVEIGLNENIKTIIAKINDKHKKISIKKP